MYLMLMILSFILFVIGAWRLPPCWEPVGWRDFQALLFMLLAIAVALLATVAKINQHLGLGW